MLGFDGVAGEGRDICTISQWLLVGVPDRGQRGSEYSPELGTSPTSTLGRGNMSGELVLLILTSSLSMGSVGIWKACQLSRARIHNNHRNNSGATTRKEHTVEGDLQDLWTSRQERRFGAAT